MCYWFERAERRTESLVLQTIYFCLIFSIGQKEDNVLWLMAGDFLQRCHGAVLMLLLCKWLQEPWRNLSLVWKSITLMSIIHRR